MARSVEVISHWHHSVEGFNTSALDFYSSIEQALEEKDVPELQIEQTEWSEAGLLSAKRIYLRVSYGRFSFDICAAPFGTDFFFSWWLVKRRPGSILAVGCGGTLLAFFILVGLTAKLGILIGPLIAAFIVIGSLWAIRGSYAADFDDAIVGLPVIGYLYQRFVKPVTYYSTDTRLIFEETVKRVVEEIVNGLLTVAKLPPLSPRTSTI